MLTLEAVCQGSTCTGRLQGKVMKVDSGLDDLLVWPVGLNVGANSCFRKVHCIGWRPELPLASARSGVTKSSSSY